MKDRPRNRLASETSPYLLQHADNPVDWYPWGEEALGRSRAEDKPILLSIGYSACHWCHVMAHECFENENIARLMNESFVNIKVDREERPDLDTVYMAAVQSITGSGGWPLTVFLTPDTRPFFGGTYFPPDDRHGTPGFPRVLRAVIDAYRNRRGEVAQATGQIMAALTSRADAARPEPLTAAILSQVYQALRSDFDDVNGGFGAAPKFPQAMVLEFLLRYAYRTHDSKAQDMVTLTLEKMASGGIYDQIGGGFHRYATDNRWLVPHFEKMLYDNALLSQVYLHACQITKSTLFCRIAEETFDYVLREMTSPEGGFYSAQDADSEGVEGKYYLWTPDEIADATVEPAGRIIGDYYGVTSRGNFEGGNILHVAGDSHAEAPGIVSEARACLLKRRQQRVPPGRDGKTVASWNGLMLASLAEAAGVLDRKDYLAAAVASGAFLLNQLTSGEYLKHTYQNGRAIVEGYLEDYANVIDGLLNLHQATFSGEFLRRAIRLAELMIEEFWDESSGTFYDSASRHQALFIRPKNTHDGALPSGSSTACLSLLKVARLTGNERMDRIAARSLGSMREQIIRYPLGSGHWLCALDFYLSSPKEIAIIGTLDSPATMELRRVLFSMWLPNKVVAACDPDDRAPLAGLKLFENRSMVRNLPTAYVCEHQSCRTPVTDPDLFRKQLQDG